MFNNKKRYAVFFILIVLFQKLAFAEVPRLINFVTENTRDDLIICLNAEGAFPEKIKTAITSGVPVTFSFFINLYQVRSLWPDKKIAGKEVNHTIKYNNLKKEYIITKVWQKEAPFITHSFKDAQKHMMEIDSLKLVPLSMLEKGRQYQIKTKAGLLKQPLPFYLHYIFFFISLGNFETDWYTIAFIY